MRLAARRFPLGASKRLPGAPPRGPGPRAASNRSRSKPKARRRAASQCPVVPLGPPNGKRAPTGGGRARESSTPGRCRRGTARRSSSASLRTDSWPATPQPVRGNRQKPRREMPQRLERRANWSIHHRRARPDHSSGDSSGCPAASAGSGSVRRPAPRRAGASPWVKRVVSMPAARNNCSATRTQRGVPAVRAAWRSLHQIQA